MTSLNYVLFKRIHSQSHPMAVQLCICSSSVHLTTPASGRVLENPLMNVSIKCSVLYRVLFGGLLSGWPSEQRVRHTTE